MSGWFAIILELKAQTNVQMCSSVKVREGIQIFDNFIISAIAVIICYILAIAMKTASLSAITLSLWAQPS
jgi:hypothetical protein